MINTPLRHVTEVERGFLNYEYYKHASIHDYFDIIKKSYNEGGENDKKEMIAEQKKSYHQNKTKFYVTAEDNKEVHDEIVHRETSFE